MGHHVAITRDGTTLRMYINGKLSGTTDSYSLSGAFANTTDQFMIGSSDEMQMVRYGLDIFQIFVLLRDMFYMMEISLFQIMH